MRQCYTIILFLTCFASIAQENEIETKSKIQHVTVFLQGAQITRDASVTLKSGVSVIKFTNISPSVVEQSLRAESATESIKILSVSYAINYLQHPVKPEKLSALESERRRLLGLLAEEKSQLEVYAEEEVILKTNRSIGGTAKGVPIEELKVAMDYFRQRLTDIKQRILQIDRNTRQYNESLGKVDAQIAELSGGKIDPVGEVSVKVSTKTPVTVSLSISYLVQEARWYPAYDIRAKDIKSPVAITYKANISQSSGENWDNVKLTVSSGNPSQIGSKPEMKAWYLGFNNSVGPTTIGTVYNANNHHATLGMVTGRVVDDAGQGMPGVNVRIKGTTVGAVTDSEGYYSVMLTRDATALVFSFIGFESSEVQIGQQQKIDVSMVSNQSMLQEVVVTGYGVQKKSSMTGSVASIRGRVAGVAVTERKVITATPVVRQTNVEFTLDDLFTIKSDGEMRTTDLVEYDIEALYEYYCAPKMDNDAFLVSKLLHWDELNLLSGEASLFFEGKFIGKSVIDTKNTNDTLTLSLGRDPNVVITREKVKDLSSRQLIGSNQKSVFAYDIAIRNKKALPITIVIEDQIPVANTKEITIDKLEDSRAEYNAETGILKWKKDVVPGKSEAISFKYAIRYPKTNDIVLE